MNVLFQKSCRAVDVECAVVAEVVAAVSAAVADFQMAVILASIMITNQTSMIINPPLEEM